VSLAPGRHSLGRDFWLYFSGQLISQVGSSFTLFALPLLVFKLTDSATSLGLTTVANLLPYLLFGLVLGALADRVDRKRIALLFGFSAVRHGDRYLAEAAASAPGAGEPAEAPT
jgi:MFS family permease